MPNIEFWDLNVGLIVDHLYNLRTLKLMFSLSFQKQLLGGVGIKTTWYDLKRLRSQSDIIVNLNFWLWFETEREND